jgi:hypothetical protein
MWELLGLMNTNENWMEILQGDPYNITIKQDGEYYLLQYHQFASDFNNPIVRDCRGSIFRREGARWICVCYPFHKFGNYGESYCPDIDWNTARVYEKVDGSLMKLWYDRDAWHLSTNGTINAFKAEMNGFGQTFGQYFEEALEDYYGMDFHMLENFLDKSNCYMFELVGPRNRLVVNYRQACFYLIGVRDMDFFQEIDPADTKLARVINAPRIYDISTVDECLCAVRAMSSDEEGFVVCDANFNRVKIKSLAYLTAAQLNNNGIITPRRIVHMLMEGTIDDFLAYCPIYKDEVAYHINAIKKLIASMEAEKDAVRIYFKLSKKEFWTFISSFEHKDFLSKCHYNNDYTAREYINYHIELRGADWLLNILEDYYERG